MQPDPALTSVNKRSAKLSAYSNRPSSGSRERVSAMWQVQGGFQSTSQQDGSQTSSVSVVPEIDIARVQRWGRYGVPAFAGAEVRVEADVAEATDRRWRWW